MIRLANLRVYESTCSLCLAAKDWPFIFMLPIKPLDKKIYVRFEPINDPLIYTLTSRTSSIQ